MKGSVHTTTDKWLHNSKTQLQIVRQFVTVGGANKSGCAVVTCASGRDSDTQHMLQLYAVELDANIQNRESVLKGRQQN
jgi:hypothetical protein